MRVKIDIYGFLYLGITISFIIGLLFNINDIITCFQTYDYQVWVCSVNSQLILTVVLGILWLIMTAYHIISLFCIKEVVDNEEV